MTRRECLQLGLGVGALLGTKTGAQVFPDRSSAEAGRNSRGIVKINRKRRPDLVLSPLTGAGETLVCQIPFPFQVAPRLAGLFVNLRQAGGPSQDFEAGSDIVLFDDLEKIGTMDRVRVSRNRSLTSPHDGTTAAMMVKYPLNGGFVPLGAKRADGSPHPHAGTGFGCNQSNMRTVAGPVVYDQKVQDHEIHQLAFDGKTFRVAETRTRPKAEPLIPGWFISHAGLCNAIPDGDDFLLPMAGSAVSSTSTSSWLAVDGCGAARWRRLDGRWQPVAYTPVTPHGGDAAWAEPSMVRDLDGTLLFCARDERPNPNLRYADAKGESNLNDINVWKSSDGGRTWSRIVHERLLINGPVSINQALDGTPYVASCLYDVQTWALKPEFARRDSEGRPIHGGWLREKLYAWPLNADRNGVEAPLAVRRCRDEFGPPPGGSTWIADHPTSATVRLADGRWHSVIGYRLMEAGERDNGLKPTAQTGSYVEEVVASGPPVPAWIF